MVVLSALVFGQFGESVMDRKWGGVVVFDFLPSSTSIFSGQGRKQGSLRGFQLCAPFPEPPRFGDHRRWVGCFPFTTLHIEQLLRVFLLFLINQSKPEH